MNLTGVHKKKNHRTTLTRLKEFKSNFEDITFELLNDFDVFFYVKLLLPIKTHHQKKFNAK
jgi:hypothetical protein